MSDFLLTQEVLADLSKLPARTRKRAIVEIGAIEWDRCADDPMYWIDPSKHPLMPYVYTLDRHPQNVCLLCDDDATHGFNKRKTHLAVTHDKKLDDEREIKAFFRELPTTRPLPLREYFEPIVRVWQREQFVFVEKSRDVMATWLMVMLYTWDTIFHTGRQNIFQSQTGPKTYELVERAAFIYDHQPKFLKRYKTSFTAGTNRSGMFEVEALDSQILGFAQGPEQIRQYHPSGVYQDEAAFQVEAAAAFAAIKPSIQNGGRYSATSSANPSWFMLCVKDMLEQG